MSKRVLFAIILSAAAACGQRVIGEKEVSGRLLSSDAAILESHSPRIDLACVVKPVTPEVGFDLRFHSGYTVSVPLQELVGTGGRLTALFRVIADEAPEKQVYFTQSWAVSAVSRDTDGAATLYGHFVLGEGRYQVAWLMRDDEGRYCSMRFSVAATLRGKDRQIELRQAPRSIASETVEAFGSEAPVIRHSGHPFKVAVMLNVVSAASSGVGIQNPEAAAILSILRSIAREPSISSYSITAFNMDRRKVLYRRLDAPQLDFPELGASIKAKHLGTVDVQALTGDQTGMGFLGELLAEEVATDRPDALIFVGPKTLPKFGINGGSKALGNPPCPVFYLYYDADPMSNPWRDLIGSIVRLWKGAEYSITKPRDLFLAWNAVASRLSDPAVRKREANSFATEQPISKK